MNEPLGPQSKAFMTDLVMGKIDKDEWIVETEGVPVSLDPE